MNTNEFMLQLHKRLLEKTYGTPPRNLGETTANAYIKTLYTLNDKKPFKTLGFLKKTATIEEKLKNYAESTKKTILASIASVLSLEKDTPGYKKTYKYYYDKMMEKAADAKSADSSEKTNKQAENWVEWNDVLEKYKELKTKTVDSKNPDWSRLQDLLLLGLYTEIPPRRNQDYLSMDVVRATKRTKLESLPTDKNYLILRGKVPTNLIFNVYKTSKTYGQQNITIPESLSKVIATYIKHHPLAKVKGSKQFAFLVSEDGTPLTADNAITRILNKLFGKKVGSSMLRHIYLSSKYDIGSMTNDAEAMGHSLSQQRDYLKKTPSSQTLVEEPDSPQETSPPAPQ